MAQIVFSNNRICGLIVEAGTCVVYIMYVGRIYGASIYTRMCMDSTLQRKNADNLKQIFPEKEYRGLSPNFHIHVSVSELYIYTMGLPFLLEEICGPILGIYKSLFPEKEYINGIAVAV
jgi:hypothetical protein